MSFQQFQLKYNSNNNWIQIFPNTLKEDLIGANLGELFGPFTITLSKNDWNNNTIIVNNSEILETDLIFCLPILSGSNSQMNQQLQNYNLIDTNYGVESLDGQIVFTCNSTPTIDLSVQIFWFR